MTAALLADAATILLLAVGAITAWAVVRLAQRIAASYRPQPGDAAWLDTADSIRALAAADAVAIATADTEWLECHGDCVHLSTPHERTTAETATCQWCGAVAITYTTTTED